MTFEQAPPFEIESWSPQEYETLITKAKRDMKKTWNDAERDVLVPMYPEFKAACKEQDPRFDNDNAETLKNWIIWRMRKLKEEHAAIFSDRGEAVWKTGTKPGAIAKLFSNWKDAFRRDLRKDITEHHFKHCVDSPRAPSVAVEKAIKELTKLVARRVTGRELYLAEHSAELNAALAISSVENNAGRVRQAKSMVINNASEEELEAYDEKAAQQENEYDVDANRVVWPEALQFLMDAWSRGPVGAAQMTLMLSYKEKGIVKRAIIDGSHSDDIPGFSATLTKEEQAELLQRFSAYAEQVLPNDQAPVINHARPIFEDRGPESLKQHLVDLWKYTHRMSNESPIFPWEDMAQNPGTYFDTKKYASFSVSADGFSDPCTLASMSGVFVRQLFDFYEPDTISAQLEARKTAAAAELERQAEEDARRAKKGLSRTKKRRQTKTQDIDNDVLVISAGDVPAESDEDADNEGHQTYESDEEDLGFASDAEIEDNSGEELAGGDEQEAELVQPEEPKSKVANKDAGAKPKARSMLKATPTKAGGSTAARGTKRKVEPADTTSGRPQKKIKSTTASKNTKQTATKMTKTSSKPKKTKPVKRAGHKGWVHVPESEVPVPLLDRLQPARGENSPVRLRSKKPVPMRDA